MTAWCGRRACRQLKHKAEGSVSAAAQKQCLRQCLRQLKRKGRGQCRTEVVSGLGEIEPALRSRRDVQPCDTLRRGRKTVEDSD